MSLSPDSSSEEELLSKAVLIGPGQLIGRADAHSYVTCLATLWLAA
jgi:hypothetical protein